MFSDMFTYTENNIESHRNTENINIYPKAHQQHENTYQFLQNKNSKNDKIHIKKKKEKKKTKFQRCMLICIALILFYVEGHRAQLVLVIV